MGSRVCARPPCSTSPRRGQTRERSRRFRPNSLFGRGLRREAQGAAVGHTGSGEGNAMPTVFIDRLSHIGFYNGVLRIECTEATATGQERPSGTLLIPANQAGQVLQSLLKAAQELEKKMREAQAAQQQPT